MMIVTLDTCCFNIRGNTPLDEIFELQEQDEIEIVFADAVTYEILMGKIKIEDLPEKKQEIASRRLEKAKQFRNVPSWQTFKNHFTGFPMRFFNQRLFDQLADILFRDYNEEIDEMDVRQIFAHKCENNDVFITNNTHHFINNGRREKLGKIGIKVQTPEEFIDEWH